MTPNVVATSECGYAFRLMFCHPANKNHYAQIISEYVPDFFNLHFSKKMKFRRNSRITMFLLVAEFWYYLVITNRITNSLNMMKKYQYVKMKKTDISVSLLLQFRPKYQFYQS